MSRPHCVPNYHRHKQSGQAVVTLADGLGNRRDVLLGKHGTAASRAEYARVIAEWEAGGRRLSAKIAVEREASVNEVVLVYWRFAEEYYRHPDGTPTSEAGNIRRALRPLRKLYGYTPAAAFDSLALEAVRDQMIRDGLCRNRVNKDVLRVKRLFRWAAAKKLVPLASYQILQTVEGIRAGRSPQAVRKGGTLSIPAS